MPAVVHMPISWSVLIHSLFRQMPFHVDKPDNSLDDDRHPMEWTSDHPYLSLLIQKSSCLHHYYISLILACDRPTANVDSHL
jgi:hypothetical protein